MRRKRKITFWAIAIFCGLIQWPSPARATLITIEIEALVDSVDDPDNYLGGLVNVGDLISGTYAYDTATPDTSASARIGNYGHYLAPAGVALSVAGIQFKTDPTSVDFWVGIVDDYPPVDNYGFISYSNLAIPGLDVPVGDIYWSLEDSTGNALSSDALPTTAPVLDDWGFNRLSFGGGTRARGFVIQGHVTSAVVIPEPATVLLMSFGGLLFIRRPKR